MSLRQDAEFIIQSAIKNVLPDEAVNKALKDKTFDDGDLYVVAIGKAAYQMAKKASEILNNRIKSGIVITKYNHVKENIENIECFEAGHPVPDDNTFKATQKVIDLVSNLKSNDTVIFLVSGGGSALFEKPLIDKEELQDITNQLLSCGADIKEINTIRKRLSLVKGGKFAKLCEPAKIYSIVLSDIIGDPLDMIASGPTYPDSSSSIDALNIIKKYNLKLSDNAIKCLEIETPKEIKNVETIITGSVKKLCEAAKTACNKLGYQTVILNDQISCEAKDAGFYLGNIAKENQESKKSLAFIIGGETVVRITGKGKGGRNQEIALACSISLNNLKNTACFSIGSDGTDGPTDAAGGYVDNDTYKFLLEKGIDVVDVLKNNDSYNALKQCDGLIITGPTGTNVNDVSVLLIKR